MTLVPVAPGARLVTVKAAVLLSSHASVPPRTPSPQNVTQMLGVVPMQVKPDSTVHSDEQPSALIALESSQPSLAAFTPSPHVVAQMLGAVPAQT